MTETLAPPTPATATVTERIEKLERTVKRLRKKVRRLDRDELSDFVLTPEMEAELDRRIASFEADPNSGIPAEVVFEKLKVARVK